MVEMRQVDKTFRNAAGEFRVLKGIDLTLRRGEFVAIVGKSGSGKSTLLNMLTGIDHPTAGRVRVAGVDIHAMGESERSRWRGRNLGIVFQFFQLLPMLTLLENVMLPMDYAAAYDFDDRPQRAMDLLRMVGLGDQAYQLPDAVSTGQQQSAAIARALATDPPLIVADEPTGNLDSRSAATIIALFDELVRRGKTIAMVTHDASLAAHTSRTIVISDGELIDETLARALPLLSHRKMLEATRAFRRHSFPPGEIILVRDQPVDAFWIITSGYVEVIVDSSAEGADRHVRLGPGNFFGEIELLRGSPAVAGIRACPESAVELAALDSAAFSSMLEGSPLAHQSLQRLAEARLMENRLARRPRSEASPAGRG
jgi:ABC-type lipoprotein export system ATPase subunit